jgi:hypothetical protein
MKAGTLGLMLGLGLTGVIPLHAQAQQSGAPTPSARVAEGLLARQDGVSEFAPVRFDPRSAPLPLRYNNYAAIKRPGRDTWEGQTGTGWLGYARFEDPAYAIAGFIDLMRTYHVHYKARSALDIFSRYAPESDCTGAVTRTEPGCPENTVQPRIYAGRAAAALGLRPTDDLQLFRPDGTINHERMRGVIDAVVTQEIGAPYCPQPPRGQKWLGCTVSDDLYRRAMEVAARTG